MQLIESKVPYEPQLETILGVERQTAIHHLKVKQGVSIQSVEAFCDTMRYDSVSMPRRRMEADKEKMHYIVYGVIRQRNTWNVLTYQRPDKGGESRLGGKHSVGIGGHVDAVDFCVDEKGVVDTFKTLEMCALREFSEEIAFSNNTGDGHRWSLQELIESNSELFFHGFIIDQTEDVGITHLGVFMTLWVDDDVLIDSGEPAVINPHWTSLETCIAGQMKEDYNYENWSAFAIQHMYSHPRDVAPTYTPEIKTQYSTLIPNDPQ